MLHDKLTLGSLFDGSGGFPLGGLLSGITPVWASEIEPFPIRVTTKRLPFMKHYGDVSRMDGAEVEPVDIITFGSPCQDMSIAGKRAGLGGSRSNLFYEAIRIVKEMRCATDGKYPRYIVWENVPGAFSSNKGADFQSVLEEVCSVKGYEIHTPRPERWANAGEIMADDFSLAWRVFDAQYWGVPQRRKRIYLVADFAGGGAGKILFESEGVSGYTPQGFRPWQGTAGTFAEGAGASGCVCLNDQGGSRMDVTEDVAATLRAENHGHPPCVMGAAGFWTEHSAPARGIGYEEETSPTLRAGTVPAAVYENHSQDTRYTGPLETAPTVNATYGMGGNNQPLVVDENSSSDDPPPLALELPAWNNAPPAQQETVFCITGNAIDRQPQNGGNGIGYQEGIAYTLTATDHHAVFSRQRVDIFKDGEVTSTQSARQHKDATDLVLQGTDHPRLIRRLTPLECERLQGFPDGWTDIPNVSDSSRYKALGNSVAIPCVDYVLQGIALVLRTG